VKEHISYGLHNNNPILLVEVSTSELESGMMERFCPRRAAITSEALAQPFYGTTELQHQRCV